MNIAAEVTRIFCWAIMKFQKKVKRGNLRTVHNLPARPNNV